MIIYVCITLWIILISGLCSRVFKFDEIEHHYVIRPSWIHAFLAMGPVVFFIGLRSAGADTETYIGGFNKLPAGFNALFSSNSYKDTSEYLFKAFGILCKTITRDYHFYIFLIALITGILIAITLRNNTEYFGTAMILFMLTGMYTWMINGIRQFLAVAIIFAGIKLIEKKKWLAYIAIVAIAFFIHNSAIVMVPVVFLVQGKAWNKKTILVLLLCIAAVLFVNEFVRILGNVTDGTVFDGYADNLGEYGGSNIIRTIIFAIPPALALIGRKQVDERAPKIIHICVNMSIICVGISLIANFTSGILIGRLPIYFSVFNLILLPWLVNEVYKENKIIKITMFVCYGILFFLECNSYYYSNLLFGGHILPAWF